MASLSAVVTAFEKRLRLGWDEVTYPIAWDNVVFNAPTGAWIRPTLIPGITENEALGPTSIRHNGIYWVQVFIPTDSAVGLGYTLAELISGLFSNQTFDGVVCYTSSINRTGDDGKGWFQIDVRTTFYSSERI